MVLYILFGGLGQIECAETSKCDQNTKKKDKIKKG